MKQGVVQRKLVTCSKVR